jgi:hypothetical protein
VRLHLAKQGKLIAHCNSVTEEVQQREGACVKANNVSKRKREIDVKAAQEASHARQAVHAIRLKEKIKRGIVTLKDGKTVQQRLRKGTFGSGDALNWALADEKLVDWWCLNGLALHLIDCPDFKEIIKTIRATSAMYNPPSSRNDGRPSCFESILQDRQADVNAAVDLELARIVTCGATIVSDAATVHRRPVSNFMLKAAIHKLPMMLDLVDSTTSLQNGENRDAEWYARKTVDLIRSTPNAGRHIVLQVGDTVAEQLCMFELVEAALPWMSHQLGICHGVNRILTIVGDIPAVKAVLDDCMEIVDWFMNYKIQHAVLSKHATGTLVTPCDSRYGFNFIAVLKLLTQVVSLQKAVGDAAYIEAHFENDIIKPRVNDTGFWNRVADVSQYVFPYLRLLRTADSNAPMLSKVHGRKMQLEEQFKSWLSGAVTTTSSGTVVTDELRDTLIRPIYEAKDHPSQSGPSYWENLTSEFALAAGVLDPEFWSLKPWLWPGAIDAVQAQFRKRYVGPDIESATRQMLIELDLYKDKRGKFAPVHLWPQASDKASMRPAWQFWSGCAITSAGPTLGAFCP